MILFTFIMNNISKIENDDQTYEYFNQPIDNNVNVQQPQKKTRNRQALSCTECKRRKIKVGLIIDFQFNYVYIKISI